MNLFAALERDMAQHLKTISPLPLGYSPDADFPRSVPEGSDLTNVASVHSPADALPAGCSQHQLAGFSSEAVK